MTSAQLVRTSTAVCSTRALSVKQQRRPVLVRVASDDASTQTTVKLPATHVSASQNALKQIETSNAMGVNSTFLRTEGDLFVGSESARRYLHILDSPWISSLSSRCFDRDRPVAQHPNDRIGKSLAQRLFSDKNTSHFPH